MAIYAWLTRWNGIRVPVIVYGAHTATTMIPILGAIASAPGLAVDVRARLVAIYAPYLLMPLALLWRAAARPVMFGKAGGAAAAAAQQQKVRGGAVKLA